jgi:hypothetical protein
MGQGFRRLFASDEGGEFGGLPVRVQLTEHYDEQPASPTAGARWAGWVRDARRVILGGCLRATKEANLAGCPSECN